LKVETLPLGDEACFLMCNTGVKHALVDGEYNQRRGKCEEAARAFAAMLPHRVTHLRDVNWEEWEQHSGRLEPVAARRAAHVIGENTRVLRARDLLIRRDLNGLGQLMFESHVSSRVNFENSCPELDFLVDVAARVPGVLGARLSGGGFGGSIVVLTHPRDAEIVGKAIGTAYRKQHRHACDVRTVVPSAGARVLNPPRES
jgi:galactokinase